MSRFRSRRAAALSLTAALVLVLPPPSQAAKLWETPVISRVWSWIESLGIVQPATRSRRPTAPWAKEGSAIDPDGRTTHALPPQVPPASALSGQGSAIDPDG